MTSQAYYSTLLIEFARYLLIERGFSRTTLKSYKPILNRFFEFVNFAPPTEITKEHIRSFLYRKPYAEKSVAGQLDALRAFFSFLVEFDRLNSNPTLGIHRPRLKQRLPQILPEKELNQILSFCQGSLEYPRDRLILTILLFTGIRKRELLNLRWKDFYPEVDTLLIRHGKGGKDRTVPLHPHLKRMLATRQSEIQPEENQPILTTRQNKKITEETLYQTFRRLEQKTGIKTSPHKLRHAFGSLLYRSTNNIVAVQEILGHADISTTKIYVQLTQAHLLAAVKSLPLLK